MQENDAFCKFCRDMMDEHRVVIPKLAIGCAARNVAATLT